MKLSQLEHFLAVVENDFNLSTAAIHLFTTQPAVSKQIGALEEELGVKLFVRRGKKFTSMTNEGRRVHEYARRALAEVDNIRHIGEAFSTPDVGYLSIATTHTQARYLLPRVLPLFRRWYPDVELHIEQNSPQENARLVAEGRLDFAINTEALEGEDELVTIPCYRWNRRVIIPTDHPLMEIRPITLEAIAEYPIISYARGFTGRPKLDQAFIHHGLRPNLAIAASDADVIKTYVRLGMGVGIIAQMAYDSKTDQDLAAIDASHLFPDAVTWVAYRKDRLLKKYMFDFVRLLAPRLKLTFEDGAIRGNWTEMQIPMFG